MADRSQATGTHRTPAYMVLADTLEGLIATMEPGALVPSEHELVALHSVSRLTARAALQELESRFLVRRVRGSGTFVTRRIRYPIEPDMPPGVSEAIRRGGAEPTNRVTGTRTRRPTAEVALALDLDHDERVVSITRAGRLDDLAAWYGTAHLPADLVEGISERVGDDTSIVRVLIEEFGMHPVRRWARARLMVVPPEVAPHLGLEGRPLVWRIDTCNEDRSLGRPVELSQLWLRPDVFDVELQLGPAT